MSNNNEYENNHVEQRYRALVDDAPYAIVIVDIDKGVFVEEANHSAEKIFGMPKADLLGKFGPHDLSPEFQPDGRRSDEAAAGYTQMALKGENPTFEWTHRTVHGDDVACQITLSRFPDPKRNLVRVSIIDLTERKRAEATQLELQSQLSQARKLEAIGQMTGGVAHDFNNLLSVIVGNLELLSDALKADDNAHALIQNALDACEKGAALTHAMLNYARRAPLQPKTILLSDVVRNTQNLISRTIPANISIETKLNVEKWLIHADPAGTESALLNLVLNARDAMPKGGKLTIEIKSLERARIHDIPELYHDFYLVLSVTDTGVGIPTDTMDNIFDPFFSTKGPAQNSGMGLSMVHGFMTQSGGVVSVKSSFGAGTKVELYFPGVVDKFNSTVNPTRKAAITTRQARILIAEDTKTVLAVFKMMLEQQGHDVLTAESGTEAEEVFSRAEKIDLLITDIIMPGPVQGFELAENLRKLDSQLAVIFVSGYLYEHDIEGSKKQNGDIRLTKPVSRRALLQAVDNALIGKPAPPKP